MLAAELRREDKSSRDDMVYCVTDTLIRRRVEDVAEEVIRLVLVFSSLPSASTSLTDRDLRRGFRQEGTGGLAGSERFLCSMAVRGDGGATGAGRSCCLIDTGCA